jgi:hypothetical protein
MVQGPRSVIKRDGDLQVSISHASALPPYLQEIVAGLPPNVGRKTGATLVTEHLFPVSHRSLEAWPLPTRHVNGRAVVPTDVLFEVAYAKFAAAPVVMGGRRVLAMHSAPVATMHRAPVEHPQAA